MAEPKRYHDAHTWRIEGAGGEKIGYALTAGPFKDTTAKVEVPSGRGRLRDVPGLAKMEEFTITCYASVSHALYDRYKAQRDASTGKGTTEPDVFEDLDFVLEDRDGSDVERIRVYDMWCSAYEMAELDRKKSDKVVETLSCSGDRFDRLTP